MEYLVQACLLVVAVIHLRLPVGVLGPINSQLSRVAIVDTVALVALVGASMVEWMTR